jgi:uncharacterized protein (DUF305 family)
MKQLFSAIALALVAATTLAGCGTDSNSSSGNTGSNSSSGSGEKFNDADVTFAQSMILHHEQAVEMAKMGQMHASTSEVKDLADKVEAAQGPEIDTLTGWLKAWGEDVPSDSGDGMDHDMGSMESDDMPGMMSDDDMMKLDAATGADFDRMFLTMMTEHHTGAIKMAKTEQSDGQNPDAVALAKKIETDQTAELAQMKDLLKSS